MASLRCHHADLGIDLLLRGAQACLDAHTGVILLPGPPRWRLTSPLVDARRLADLEFDPAALKPLVVIELLASQFQQQRARSMFGFCSVIGD
jgi:hypothetical protein